jgi:hypothetical protein
MRSRQAKHPIAGSIGTPQYIPLSRNSETAYVSHIPARTVGRSCVGISQTGLGGSVGNQVSPLDHLLALQLLLFLV